MDFNSRKKKNKNYDLYNENINIYLEENDNYILDLESKVQTLKLVNKLIFIFITNWHIYIYMLHIP